MECAEQHEELQPRPPKPPAGPAQHRPRARDGPSHSSQGGWDGDSQGEHWDLACGLRSDKGYGYLSIVNGYSIKLTGGQRFPLDFESPQGRETKLQTPTFTLLERKTKHKRERCDLAACDGWSGAGRG